MKKRRGTGSKKVKIKRPSPLNSNKKQKNNKAPVVYSKTRMILTNLMQSGQYQER